MSFPKKITTIPHKIGTVSITIIWVFFIIGVSLSNCPTVCVIRMNLLGTWHRRKLEVMLPQGRWRGVSVRVVRQLLRDRIRWKKSRARRVIWTPAESNLGWCEYTPKPESVVATQTQKSTSQATDIRSVAWKGPKVQDRSSDTLPWIFIKSKCWQGDKMRNRSGYCCLIGSAWQSSENGQAATCTKEMPSWSRRPRMCGIFTILWCHWQHALS